MTQDMMTLRALLEKSSDADLLREMIGFTAERLMALEVEGLTGAAHGERSADRITHRNGYRDRVTPSPFKEFAEQRRSDPPFGPMPANRSTGIGMRQSTGRLRKSFETLACARSSPMRRIKY